MIAIDRLLEYQVFTLLGRIFLQKTLDKIDQKRYNEITNQKFAQKENSNVQR